jgi:hypothetical protein
VLSATNSLPPVGQSVHRDSQQIFLQKHNPATSQRGAAREEHQKLKNRLVSRGLPVSLIDELLEQATIVSTIAVASFCYKEGVPIFSSGCQAA